MLGIARYDCVIRLDDPFAAVFTLMRKGGKRKKKIGKSNNVHHELH